MSFQQVFSTGKKVLSFEFFPPKEEANLEQTLTKIQELSVLQPDFMTVTYGAGGGTRALTARMVKFISQSLKCNAVAHLTCVDHSIDEIDTLLNTFKSVGVKHILALRGDPQGGKTKFAPHPNGFASARDLVQYIKARGDFSIAVAGYPETHPEALSAEADIRYLKEKVDAGAELIITQLFFEAETYFKFLEDTHKIGITTPITPGIIPINNLDQIERFTQRCAASIPPTLLSSLRALQNDPEGTAEFCKNYAIELCRTLLKGGAPGIHLYTLNNSTLAVPIIQALKPDFF